MPASAPSLKCGAKHVLQGGADAEILLTEPQLLALRRRIVRIQHARQVLRIDLLGTAAA